MGRPRFEPAPEIKAVRQGGGVEQDWWDLLKQELYRLPIDASLNDEWHRLNSTGSPCSERVQSLARFAVEHGARERDVDRLVESCRKDVADGSWRVGQNRRDEMRRRLTVGAV